jgi:hypothetical protein
MVSFYGIAKNADHIDFALNFITGQAVTRSGDQTFGWLPTASKVTVGGPCSSSRRSGDDDHAGPEREIYREDMNKIRTRPDHISSVARLTKLSINSCSYSQLLRIADFVSGDYHGAHGRACVKSFSSPQFIPGEAAGLTHLSVSRRYVVDDRISEDVLERAALRNVPTWFSDDYRKLCFAIQFLG